VTNPKEQSKWPELDAALERLFSYPVTGKYILVGYIFWLAVTVVMKVIFGNREPLGPYCVRHGLDTSRIPIGKAPDKRYCNQSQIHGEKIQCHTPSTSQADPHPPEQARHEA
jgi:hypothetical protein